MSTYTKAKEFIEDATDRSTLYDGIRAILKEDIVHYPEDWQIKRLQQLADAKYEEIGKNNKRLLENLPEEVLEMAYRKKEMQYLIENAKRHTEDFLNNEYEITGLETPVVSEAVYEAMAKEFLDRMDCNVPENSIWEGVVNDYLRDEAYNKTVMPDENQPAVVRKGRSR